MDEPNYDSFQSLFPMPMTSIEKFHWFDGNPEYPNVVFCRLRVAGKIDQEIGRRAWQYAVQRQPFGDVKAEKEGGRWNWVAGPRAAGAENQDFGTWHGTRFEFQEFENEIPPWKFSEHQIRSPSGSYLGISVGQDPADPEKQISEIWLYVHHAIGDGVGSILVINEWLIIYANLIAGNPIEKGLNRIDAHLLASRNSLGLLTWRYLKHLYKQPVALFGAAKFIFRKTAKLLPPSSADDSRPSDSEAGNTEQFPAVIGRWLDEQNVKDLSQHAKASKVMLNSVLLGQFFLSLIDWRTQQGVHQEKDCMRVVIPMSIRLVSDRRLPTANRATIVQIDRHEKDTRDLTKFYQMLDREIMIIRGWHLEKIFLMAIRMISISNRWLRHVAENDRSRGMAVFTNLGEPFRKFERASARDSDSVAFLKPFDIDSVGPIRNGTPVNATASRHGSRYRISLNFDSKLLTEQQALDLLNVFVDRLSSV